MASEPTSRRVTDERKPASHKQATSRQEHHDPYSRVSSEIHPAKFSSSSALSHMLHMLRLATDPMIPLDYRFWFALSLHALLKHLQDDSYVNLFQGDIDFALAECIAMNPYLTLEEHAKEVSFVSHLNASITSAQSKLIRFQRELFKMLHEPPGTTSYAVGVKQALRKLESAVDSEQSLRASEHDIKRHVLYSLGQFWCFVARKTCDANFAQRAYEQIHELHKLQHKKVASELLRMVDCTMVEIELVAGHFSTSSGARVERAAQRMCTVAHADKFSSKFLFCQLVLLAEESKRDDLLAKFPECAQLLRKLNPAGSNDETHELLLESTGLLDLHQLFAFEREDFPESEQPVLSCAFRKKVSALEAQLSRAHASDKPAILHNGLIEIDATFNVSEMLPAWFSGSTFGLVLDVARYVHKLRDWLRQLESGAAAHAHLPDRHLYKTEHLKNIVDSVKLWGIMTKKRDAGAGQTYYYFLPEQLAFHEVPTHSAGAASRPSATVGSVASPTSSADGHVDQPDSFDFESIVY